MSVTKTLREKYRGHSYSIDFEYTEGQERYLVGATIHIDGSLIIPSKTLGFQISNETEAGLHGDVVRYINFLVDGDKGRS